MRKRITIVVIVFAVLAVVAYFVFFPHSKETQDTITLSGNMEVTEINLGFKLPGRVIQLMTDEGRKVTAGQAVARLDNIELESIVNQNRAAMAEAATKLAELKAGSRSQEIVQAQAAVRAVDADLVRLKKDYERAEYLHRNGAVPTAQLDAARSAYDARVAQQKSVNESLSLVKEGPRKEIIQAAEDRLAQARAALRTAEERLKDTILYAPITGVVLRKNIELGETIGQGVPIYTIGDLSKPWIKVYVKETKLGLVRLGQKARITIDSIPNKSYSGWVSYIASEAEFTPKNVQTQEERVKLVFGVKVRVDNPNDEIKPGMPADVTLLLNKPEG